MNYYSTPPRSDELWHYGIKGMRWGIRRYQNEDGSLTAAGERRYQNVDKAYHDVAKAIYKREKKLKKKLKRQGLLYDDEDFGENSKAAAIQRNKHINSSSVGKRLRLSDKIVDLQHEEEAIWERNGSAKEKANIRKKIESAQNQLRTLRDSDIDKDSTVRSNLLQARLMDLGFNKQAADVLEKKTKESKRAVRRYYLD